MVADLLLELLEVGATYRHPTARVFGSMNFTMVPCWTLTFDFAVRKQPFWGARNVRPCETKTSASGTKLYKIIIQLHPQRRILCKALPLAQLLKSRVCHEFVCPIMPVGTHVFVHQSDSKATLVGPTGSKANWEHASQICADV